MHNIALERTLLGYFGFELGGDRLLLNLAVSDSICHYLLKKLFIDSNKHERNRTFAIIRIACGTNRTKGALREWIYSL
jgi:hypothetical protein